MKKVFAVMLFAFLAGCAKPPPPPPVLSLTIIGSPNQNPDASGNGTTVAVQIYQLAATGKFLSTDFYSLIGQEQTVLGTDEMGASTQILVNPGATVPQTINLKPNVADVGIAVIFREINQSTWRLVAPVAASGPSTVTVKIQGLKASLGS